MHIAHNLILRFNLDYPDYALLKEARMLLEVYQNISKFIESSGQEAVFCIKEAAKNFQCSHNTVLAIYMQIVQKRLRKVSHINSDQRIQSDHWKQFQSRNDFSREAIYNLAKQLGIPPVMLAKMFIELSEMDKNQTSTYILRNLEAIEDVNFREQVQYCLDNDDQFGPSIDLIKKSIGEEYELILKDKLTLMNIPFKDENILRDQGYDKTPDLLLAVPIAVGDNVINWIESKASFGDEHTHKQYLREQYWSYWNRFGPGLVIYWFGFVDELAEETLDKGIIIMDHMPSEVTTLI